MIFPTLYKRSNLLDKITQWVIEVEEDKYRTITGYTDGLNFTNEWTICKSKNKSKKNATNAEEQALKQAEAMFKKRKEAGYFEDIKDIDNPIFFQPMLAKEWNDEKHRIEYPIASQPKLDGVRCIIKSDGMWSRKGKRLISAPHIFESIKYIFEVFPDIILDGELYCHKDEGVDFNKIISCVRKTKPEQEDIEESEKYIKYFLYDFGYIDGEDYIFLDRYEVLVRLNGKFEYLEIVPTYSLNNEEEVLAQLKFYIEKGYEGQILRVWDSLYENKRSKYLLKYKEFITEEFEIIGIKEGLGKLSGKVGKLVFNTFESAVNGTHEYLQKLYERNDLIGKMATVRFTEYTPAGAPRFPKVIEIRDYE